MQVRVPRPAQEILDADAVSFRHERVELLGRELLDAHLDTLSGKSKSQSAPLHGANGSGSTSVKTCPHCPRMCHLRSGRYRSTASRPSAPYGSPSGVMSPTTRARPMMPPRGSVARGRNCTCTSP